MRPEPRPLPDEQARALDASVERRRQLVAMRTAEQNRLGSCQDPSVRTGIQTHLDWLLAALGDVDKDLTRMTPQSPVWREKGAAAALCAGRRAGSLEKGT